MLINNIRRLCITRSIRVPSNNTQRKDYERKITYWPASSASESWPPQLPLKTLLLQ